MDKLSQEDRVSQKSFRPLERPAGTSHTHTRPLISDCVYAQPRQHTIRACNAQQTATLVTQPPAHTFRLTHTKSPESPLPQLATAHHRDDSGDKRCRGEQQKVKITPQYLLVPKRKKETEG